MRRTTTLDSRRLTPKRRIRATLGDLIAAAYDAVGPRGATSDVARLLSTTALAKTVSPRVRFG